VKAQIEFHPLFWEDVQGHAVYLETQAQLGGEFLDAVELAIETVRTGPLMWSCLFGNIRHYLLSKFRNHVIHYEFFEDENLVRFYGLYHGAQDPAKWSDRL
jgi:hypothetical protein